MMKKTRMKRVLSEEEENFKREQRVFKQHYVYQYFLKQLYAELKGEY